MSPDFERRLAKSIAVYKERMAARQDEEVEGYQYPMPMLEDGSPDMSQWDNVTHIAKHPRWKWWS